MRSRLTLLALLVAAMAAGVLWFVRPHPQPSAGSSSTERLFAFDERSVTALTVATRGDAYRFERTGGLWRAVSPVADAADPTAIATVLSTLKRAAVLQTVSASGPAGSFGLEPPVTTIALAGVELPALEIGDVAPTGEGVFARVSGRPAVVLLKLPEATPLVALDGTRLRARTLLDLPQSAIRGVTIAPPGVRLALDKGDWWIEAPQRMPASPTAVGKMLAVITGIEVLESVDAGRRDDARFGLGDGATHVTLDAGGGPRELVLGGPAGSGRRFAWSSTRGPVLIVPDAALTALTPDPGSLRETKLTNVNRYHVRSFTYTSGDASLSLTRVGESTWKSGEREVPADAVYGLLVAVLEPATTGWSAGETKGAANATLAYASDDGSEGRIAYLGRRAVWSGAPGVTFTLAGPPPPVPSLQ